MDNSEPEIQCQPDTPDCLVNSAWVKWSSTTINKLKAENATLEAENARLRDAMHEIYRKTCLALDRAEWRDSEDYSYLYSVNKEIRDITLNWPGRTMEGSEL